MACYKCLLIESMRARRDKRCGRRIAAAEKGCTGVGGSPGRASKPKAGARIISTPVSTMGFGEVDDAFWECRTVGGDGGAGGGEGVVLAL
jgi:hypothetical protein